jgi:hypothetical protein
MIRRFLNTVPNAVRVSALALVICGTLLGLVLGSVYSTPNTFVPGPVIGFGAGLVFSSFLAIWLLSLGYVYADARRRAMRPGLWVLVAALFPHLLGFLLYFVMRQPIGSNCPHCGQTIAASQRFCPTCGHPQLQPSPQNISVGAA